MKEKTLLESVLEIQKRLHYHPPKLEEFFAGLIGLSKAKAMEYCRDYLKKLDEENDSK